MRSSGAYKDLKEQLERLIIDSVPDTVDFKIQTEQDTDLIREILTLCKDTNKKISIIEGRIKNICYEISMRLYNQELMAASFVKHKN